MTTKEKVGWGQVEEVKGGINGYGRDLTLGGEHKIQYTDDIIEWYT